MSGDVFRPIRQGGLMRCCVQTILDSDPIVDIEGAKMRCTWCSEGDMVFREGAWEWASLESIRSMLAAKKKKKKERV